MSDSKLSTEAKLTKLKSERSKIALTLLSLVVILWATSWYLVTTYIDDPANRGTFGDMFGSVNSLFSGLALAGIIYTIYVQKVELRLQRHELQMAREELARQAEAQEASGQTLKEQVDSFDRISTSINSNNDVTIKLNTINEINAINSSFDFQGIHSQNGSAQITSETRTLFDRYDMLLGGAEAGVFDKALIEKSFTPKMTTLIDQLSDKLIIEKKSFPGKWTNISSLTA